MLLKIASKKNIEAFVVQTTKIHHKLGRTEGLAKEGRKAAPKTFASKNCSLVLARTYADEHPSRSTIRFSTLILMLLWFQVLASLWLQITFHCNYILATW